MIRISCKNERGKCICLRSPFRTPYYRYRNRQRKETMDREEIIDKHKCRVVEEAAWNGKVYEIHHVQERDY